MTSTFILTTETPFSAEAMFTASLDIDVHVASMAQSGERAIAGLTSGQIGLGETVTWRARHFGIWFTMTSEIAELERPNRFVDRQVRGPFTLFVHEHEFAAVGSGSRMTDRITLASPIFGRVAERLILVPYLRSLIGKRNTHLIAALSR